MGLVPVISPRDLAMLQRQAVEAAVERRAAGELISRGEAAVKLFRERLPDRPVPREAEAMLDVLVDTEASPAHVPALAQRRLETLRTALGEAGIAERRLVEAPMAEGRDSAEGAIALNLLEPDRPRRSQLLETLRGLGGTVIGEPE